MPRKTTIGRYSFSNSVIAACHAYRLRRPRHDPGTGPPRIKRDHGPNPQRLLVAFGEFAREAPQSVAGTAPRMRVPCCSAAKWQDAATYRAGIGQRKERKRRVRACVLAAHNARRSKAKWV